MGLLGLLTGQIAAAAGCRVLGIDIDPKRIALASSLGLQAWLRDQAEDYAQTFTANRGFDMVIICADTPSNDPVELAGAIARDRARVVATGAVGLDFPAQGCITKKKFLSSTRALMGQAVTMPLTKKADKDYPIGYVRWTEGRNFEAVVDLLSNNKLQVQPLITHRFPIEQATEAYDVITGKKEEPFLGVLLTYESAESDVRAARVEFRTILSQLAPRTWRLGF